jgi:CrcB protein
VSPAHSVAVACGGAAGAAARWGVTEILDADPGGFDWTLVAVNTLGSFLLGLLLVAARDGRRELLRLGLGVGFCGSFTTFSSFAVVAAGLGRDGEVTTAAAFVMLTVAAAVAGLMAGGTAARRTASSPAP